MMSETYLDYSCYYRRYNVHYCTRDRNIPQQVTELESYTALEVKQYCCAGYQNTGSETDPKCSPVCDFLCANGKCSKPNYCECDSGYSKKSGTENICEPVCSEKCVHGYCSRPEFCSCHYGYEHQSSSPCICSPTCSIPCINANCTSPDICTCIKGFAKTLEERHKCHAVCLPHCVNGVCTSPNVCTCFEGYKKDNTTLHVCSPVCQDGCDNGVCTAPGECTCFDGFKKIENNCEPKCSQECLNGICTGPDTCTCHTGYQRFFDDPYSCFPVCSFGCVNSNCTEPDKCECSPGFEETDDPNVCRPYCTDGCENGICTQPEECTCLWGFISQGNSSNCTQQERLDCTFRNEMLHHNFNKSCFKFTGELYLTNSIDCLILQYLVSQIEKIENSNLNFYCDGVSDLELLENRFKLRLECNAKLSKIENNFFEGEFFSPSTEMGAPDLIDFTEPTVLSSSTQTLSSFFYYFDPTPSTEGTSTEGTSTEGTSTEGTSTEGTSTEGPVSSKVSEMQSTTVGSLIITSVKNILDKSEFNITPTEVSSITTQFSVVPLDLNINLKFYSLIKNSQISQDYFNTTNHSKRNVCLCHRNQKSWEV